MTGTTGTPTGRALFQSVLVLAWLFVKATNLLDCGFRVVPISFEEILGEFGVCCRVGPFLYVHVMLGNIVFGCPVEIVEFVPGITDCRHNHRLGIRGLVVILDQFLFPNFG